MTTTPDRRYFALTDIHTVEQDGNHIILGIGTGQKELILSQSAYAQFMEQGGGWFYDNGLGWMYSSKQDDRPSAALGFAEQIKKITGR